MTHRRTTIKGSRDVQPGAKQGAAATDKDVEQEPDSGQRWILAGWLGVGLGVVNTHISVRDHAAYLNYAAEF